MNLPAGAYNNALHSERYRYVRRITVMFWSLWRGRYLQSLAARSKWPNAERNMAVGDVVMEKDAGYGKGQ